MNPKVQALGTALSRPADRRNLRGHLRGRVGAGVDSLAEEAHGLSNLVLAARPAGGVAPPAADGLDYLPPIVV